MAPKLTKSQETVLFSVYYGDKMFLGRDRIYQYLRTNKPEAKISRRQVMDYLKNQKNWQENYIPRERKSTRAVLTTKSGYLQIDLIDFQSTPDRGFNFILTCIDLYTKKVSAEAIKTKSGKSVATALLKILPRYENISVVQSDNGTEFISPEVKDLLDSKGIKRLYSKAYSPQTQGTIERFNQTLERMISKLFNYTGMKKWVSQLPQLIDNYNDTIHFSTKETPNKTTDESNDVKERLINIHNKNPQNSKLVKFKVGDYVKARLKKGKIDKKAVNTFTKAVYKIVKVLNSKKPYVLDSYKLEDADGDLIEGYLNASELLLIPNYEPPNNKRSNEDEDRQVKRKK